jgi:hypothetical protein
VFQSAPPGAGRSARSEGELGKFGKELDENARPGRDEVFFVMVARLGDLHDIALHPVNQAVFVGDPA